MHLLKRLLPALAVAAAVVVPHAANAQWKPEKPIQLIVGFSAGGATDVIARALAGAANPFIPVPIVVVNRPGAAGTSAAQMVAKSAPDGYTLLVAGGSESTSAPVHRAVGYDPAKDFTPIILIARLRIMLAVRADSPWKTMGDFIADAKAHPGKYTFASAGNGGIYHSTMLVLSKETDLKLKHVPYQSGAQAAAALLGGHVDIAPLSPDEAKAQYEAGQIRILAQASEDPYQPWKDIPTLKSLGYDVVLENMKGIVGPAGMSKDVVAYLQGNFKKAMESETFAKMAEKAQLETTYKSGPEFGAAMQRMRDAVSASLK